MSVRVSPGNHKPVSSPPPRSAKRASQRARCADAKVQAYEGRCRWVVSDPTEHTGRASDRARDPLKNREAAPLPDAARVPFDVARLGRLLDNARPSQPTLTLRSPSAARHPARSLSPGRKQQEEQAGESLLATRLAPLACSSIPGHHAPAQLASPARRPSAERGPGRWGRLLQDPGRGQEGG